MTNPILDLGLPTSVTDKVLLHPTEDLLLAVLREGLPGVPIFTLIPMDVGAMQFFVTIRRVPTMGNWRGDPRFMDHITASVQIFTKDPNADEKAALIGEAIRVTLFEAAREQKVYPFLGHLKSARMDEGPSRQTDWASTTGPVQYADLPAGFARYQATFSVRTRRPTA